MERRMAPRTPRIEPAATRAPGWSSSPPRTATARSASPSRFFPAPGAARGDARAGRRRPARHAGRRSDVAVGVRAVPARGARAVRCAVPENHDGARALVDVAVAAGRRSCCSTAGAAATTGSPRARSWCRTGCATATTSPRSCCRSTARARRAGPSGGALFPTPEPAAHERGLRPGDLRSARARAVPARARRVGGRRDGHEPRRLHDGAVGERRRSRRRRRRRLRGRDDPGGVDGAPDVAPRRDTARCAARAAQRRHHRGPARRRVRGARADDAPAARSRASGSR